MRAPRLFGALLIGVAGAAFGLCFIPRDEASSGRVPRRVLEKDRLQTLASPDGRDAENRKADWPNLFGPNHDNRSDCAVNVDWNSERPPELWRIPIGTGYSSPIVIGRRVIVLHRLEDEEIVSCLDADSGETQWEHRYPTSFTCGSHYTSGPYSTPAANENCVVTLGAQGQLHCLDLETGNVLWQHDTVARFQVALDIFGAGHSPLIWNDRAILNIGGSVPQSGIIAFDLSLGRVHWQATGDGPSFATPVPLVIHGEDRMLVLTQQALVMLDPHSGGVLDRYEISSSIPDGYNAVTPVVWQDLVLVSVFGEGSVCLRIADDDRLVEQWTDKRALTSQYNPILVHDGFVYGVHALDKSFRCVELASGKLKWRSKSPLARSTQLIAGNQILLFGEFGELGALDLDPDVCTQRALTAGSVFDGERCFSAPALCDGRLYLRNEQWLVCLDLQHP